MAKLRYVFDAVAQIKRALKGRVPLIGFAGSPFTLACYMIEGGGSADFATVRQMAYARPDLLARLVATNTRAVTAYLNEQIAAGADAVMIFDTWGGLLTTDAYRAIVAGADARRRRRPAPRGRTEGAIPSIVFTKGGGAWLAEIAAIGAAASDSTGPSTSPPRDAAWAARVALQGNLDPVVLLTDPATVAREATKILARGGSRARAYLQSGARHRARARRRTMSRRWSRPCIAISRETRAGP